MTIQLFRNAYSLRAALTLFMVVPLVSILAIAGYLSLSELEKQTEKRMQEDVELIARAIRLPLSHALEQDREGDVKQALNSAFHINRVYGAYVYNAQGKKVAATGAKEPSMQSRKLIQLAAEGNRRGQYGEFDGEEIYSYFVPLTDSSGLIIGLLQLTRQGSDFQDYLGQIRWQGLLLLVLLALLLTGVVIYGQYRSVGRYLAALMNSMAMIEQGDRTHRAPLQGPRELVALSACMNNMLDSIAHSEAEISRRRAEQSTLENRLRQSQKMAAIGQLAAGTAHELGTPLSVVDGKAQRLLRLRDLPLQVTEGLQEIRDAVKRMEHIVRQLMDFGRATPLSLHPEVAARLAQAAVSQVRDEFAHAGVQLELAGPHPAPLMLVDPVRIEQVLINLLRNGMQASPGGHVRLSWFQEGELTGFCVEDDGPGIDDEIHSRLFEPFFTTKPVGQGTGLGLSVVHGAIEEHHGSIEVGRSLLGGAAFYLFFPPLPKSLQGEYLSDKRRDSS
ncbi:sensor histidine kinase [Nitrosococcus wardiae]|uniref:histidine kinase n=1 Tax=Nitrosococcus wardiae TaxID=1814290 RepID=A0A4V1AVS8_9GAMM|nr:ATP-binding protein [Nitrosococcus wardiae]QBQ54185.1 HAMP domain-containing protein [Nitrosococcus wardiae]